MFKVQNVCLIHVDGCHLVIWHHSADQTVSLRLVRVNLVAGENHLHGLGLADGADQTLSSTTPCKYSIQTKLKYLNELGKSPGITPSRISGWPNLADSEAMIMSHVMANSHPPPKAKPETAAIV